MSKLLSADKLTHYAVGTFIALALLPLGWQVAAAGVTLAAIGREVYGRVKRGRRMNCADWRETAQDIGATVAGGAVLLGGAYIGV